MCDLFMIHYYHKFKYISLNDYTLKNFLSYKQLLLYTLHFTSFTLECMTDLHRKSISIDPKEAHIQTSTYFRIINLFSPSHNENLGVNFAIAVPDLLEPLLISETSRYFPRISDLCGGP